MMTIAVLITSYNRKEKTLACLDSLKNQCLPTNTSLTYFITDDDSSDGTANEIKKRYPSVNLYKGNGSLFWAGGMRNSWKKALESNPDYYLLLNDDTLLYENAISSLLNCYDFAKTEKKILAICVGSTVDADKKTLSYGGRKLASLKSWNSGSLVFSEKEYLDCDVANANILLVPNLIVKAIGILSENFTHGLADYDYTLKAKKAGYGLLVAPGFLGTCSDDHGNNWKSANTTFKERLAYLKSPKGLAYKEYLGFIKEHFPRSYMSSVIKLWMKTVFPFVWDTFKK